MSVHARCSSCGAEYDLTGNMAGRLVRCDRCLKPFRVPGAATADPPPPPRPVAVSASRPRRLKKPDARIPDDRPRGGRQRRHEEKDEPPPPRRRPAGLIAVAIMAGAVVVAAVALAVSVALSGRAPDGGLAKGGDAPPDPVKWPEPDPAPPAPDRQPEEKPAPAAEAPPPAAAILAADPAPPPIRIPDDVRVSIPAGDPVQVLFPTTPSPFVAVAGTPRDGKVTYTVWNLQTGRQAGAVTVGEGQYNSFNLSPDGAHLIALVSDMPSRVYEVWTVADGRSLRRLDPDDPLRPRVYPADFAGPGLLLSNQQGRDDNLIRVWDLANGQCLRRCEAPVSFFGLTVKALSPGRRYLASLHKQSDRVAVCDLTTGKMAGELLLPRHDPLRVKSWSSLGFSRDGKSLYGLYFSGLDLYLATWDVATGRAGTRRLRGLVNEVEEGSQVAVYNGERLEGLDDGNVLIGGRIVLDPKSATVVRTLPWELFEGNVRRVFGTKWAFITVANGERRLVVQPLPPR